MYFCLFVLCRVEFPLLLHFGRCSMVAPEEINELTTFDSSGFPLVWYISPFLVIYPRISCFCSHQPYKNLHCECQQSHYYVLYCAFYLVNVHTHAYMYAVLLLAVAIIHNTYICNCAFICWIVLFGVNVCVIASISLCSFVSHCFGFFPLKIITH